MPPVTVATFETPFEAEIVRGRLASEGIAAVVADAGAVTADWTMSTAIGGVRLRVPEAEADRARALLAETPDPEPAAGDDATQTDAEALAGRAFKASFLGLGLPPLQVYALVLVGRYFGTDGGKSARTARQVAWSLLFMVPWAAFAAFLLVAE